MRHLGSFLTFALVILLAHRANGQAVMPDGWQSLPADQFAAAAETFFDAGPSDDVAREVVEHAWQTFLNDEAFVTSGDWDTVEHMMNQFLDRRELLIAGETFADRESAASQLQSDLAALQARVSARLDGDSGLVTNSTFEELLTLDAGLESAGEAKADRAERFIAWMNANNWQSLSLAHHALLLVGIEADQLDRLQMSVRWTGFLTAPATGSYTVEQLRHYRRDSGMRITVGGKEVLNSVDKGGDEGEDVDSEAYRSQPIELTANTPVPIQVELVHESPSVDHNFGYPMAVLMWESDSIEQQIIPQSGFSPPEGYQGEGTEGLVGEYYRGTELDPANLVTTRLDSGLQFIWKWRPVVPQYPDQWQAIRNHRWPDLLDDTFLSALTSDEAKDEFFRHGAKSFNGWSNATQRQAFAAKLLQHPQLIRSMTPYHMGKTVEHLYMLPNKPHLELIGRWAELTEQPRHQLGVYPGYGEGTYYEHNLDYYWLTGHFFVPAYWADVQKLMDDHLIGTDGACNLRVAYVATWSAKYAEKAGELRTRIEQPLEDEAITGDVRMTWLLAKAYLAEVAGFGQPSPGARIPLLQEALLIADSNEARFWALQELVARLGSLDRQDEANEMIDRYASEFTDQQQQAEIARWREEMARIAGVHQAVADDTSEQAIAQHQAYMEKLQQRLQRAQARGDTADVARYQELIATARNLPTP